MCKNLVIVLLSVLIAFMYWNNGKKLDQVKLEKEKVVAEKTDLAKEVEVKENSDKKLEVVIDSLNGNRRATENEYMCSEFSESVMNMYQNNDIDSHILVGINKNGTEGHAWALTVLDRDNDTFYLPESGTGFIPTDICNPDGQCAHGRLENNIYKQQ